MKKPNLLQRFARWKTSRAELQRQIQTLRGENERLQQKLTELRTAKDRAENQAEARLREKETLRTRLSAEKKALQSQELLLEQLSAKVTELRAEIDSLNQSKKH